MGLYNVEITINTVVIADNEQDATLAAISHEREILSDSYDNEITVKGKIKDIGDLICEWEGQCIPYGGDGNTRISEILNNGSTS